MKIVVISDTHNKHHKIGLPDGDMLIHCGDATNTGSMVEIAALNVWMGSIKHRYKHILFVPGNHDKYFDDNPNVARIMLSNATVLMDESIEIDGINFYGSPYTPQYGNWSFMKPRDEIFTVWEKIPLDTDVLITHGPPKGKLDENKFGNSCGCDSLRQHVIRVKPEYHLFGHIHESPGKVTKMGTTYINASSLNHRYKVHKLDVNVINVNKKEKVND